MNKSTYVHHYEHKLSISEVSEVLLSVAIL